MPSAEEASLHRSTSPQSCQFACMYLDLSRSVALSQRSVSSQTSRMLLPVIRSGTRASLCKTRILMPQLQLLSPCLWCERGRGQPPVQDGMGWDCLQEKPGTAPGYMQGSQQQSGSACRWFTCCKPVSESSAPVKTTRHQAKSPQVRLREAPSSGCPAHYTHCWIEATAPTPLWIHLAAGRARRAVHCPATALWHLFSRNTSSCTWKESATLSAQQPFVPRQIQSVRSTELHTAFLIPSSYALNRKPFMLKMARSHSFTTTAVGGEDPS